MSDDEKIWIVFGSDGEYSDYQEWPVFAFRTEAGAKAHADTASAERRELYQRAVTIREEGRDDYYSRIEALKSKSDPFLTVDGYEDPRDYTVGMVVLR